MQISTNNIVEELYKKYLAVSDEFVKDSLKSFLIEKKRKYKFELNQLFRKYNISDPKELELKIKEHKIDEHPAWEDLIEIENLLEEIKELENDLGRL